MRLPWACLPWVPRACWEVPRARYLPPAAACLRCACLPPACPHTTCTSAPPACRTLGCPAGSCCLPLLSAMPWVSATQHPPSLPPPPTTCLYLLGYTWAPPLCHCCRYLHYAFHLLASTSFSVSVCWVLHLPHASPACFCLIPAGHACHRDTLPQLCCWVTMLGLHHAPALFPPPGRHAPPLPAGLFTVWMISAGHHRLWNTAWVTSPLLHRLPSFCCCCCLPLRLRSAFPADRGSPACTLPFTGAVPPVRDCTPATRHRGAACTTAAVPTCRIWGCAVLTVGLYCTQAVPACRCTARLDLTSGTCLPPPACGHWATTCRSDACCHLPRPAWACCPLLACLLDAYHLGLCCLSRGVGAPPAWVGILPACWPASLPPAMPCLAHHSSGCLGHCLSL